MFKFYYIIVYPLTLLSLALIKFYQKLLTHGKQKCCRFLPTCSSYAFMAIKEYGAIYGGYISLKRICRCNSKSKGGVDFPNLNINGNYKWKC